ncbi:MAG: metallophosphoesterase [bacterium]
MNEPTKLNKIFFSISMITIIFTTGLSAEKVRIAILGDRTGGHVPGIYGEIVSEIELMKPDLVINVGDMIEGYTDDISEARNQWLEYLNIIGIFSMPVYLIPGNHDIWDDNSEKLYREYIGEPDYSFDYQDIHFVILDNSRWYSSEELPQIKIDWLEQDLAPYQDKVVIVLYHRPFWFEAIAEGRTDLLHQIFVDNNVDAVFTGHYHTYFSGSYDGILYTGVGSSGAGSHPGPAGPQYHYMWVTVSDELAEPEISIAIIAKDAVYPWDEVTAGDLIFIDKLEIQGINFLNSYVYDENLYSEPMVINLQVSNINSEFAVSDTLTWEIPQNWEIDPAVVPIDLAPGESTVITVNAYNNNNSVYPLPTVNFPLPYREDRTYQVEKSISLQRTASMYPVETDLIIDGRISESCWQNPVTDLFTSQGLLNGIDSVEFYFCIDQNFIYLAAVCFDPVMDSVVAEVEERDGPVYYEDCVGYFLQPDRGNRTVYQIYVNPRGVIYDAKIYLDYQGLEYDNTWNGHYQIATTEDEQKWTVELAVPLEIFTTGYDLNNGWGLNFRRKQARLNESTNWQYPISYDPDDYGILRIK